MPLFKARRFARPRLLAPAVRPRNTTVFGRGIPKRARGEESLKMAGSKLAKETLRKFSAQGRSRVVREGRSPIREAGRLEARLEIAMREGNYEEVKRIFYEMLANAKLLEQYAATYGEKSDFARVLKKQENLLNRMHEELVRKGLIELQGAEHQ